MLKVGATLYLERKDENGDLQRYKTVLVDFKNNEFLIEVPIHEKTKKFGFFDVGDRFDCYIYMGGKVNIFHTTFLDRIMDKVPLLIMTYPGHDKVEVIQRRQHVRVNANLDVAVHPITEERQPYTSITLDVSGGGCAILQPKGRDLEENDEVQLWFVLPLDGGKYHYMTVKAQVVRLVEESGRRKASFNFVEIDDGDRMQIIRYCFQRQMQFKKK